MCHCHYFLLPHGVAVEVESYPVLVCPFAVTDDHGFLLTPMTNNYCGGGCRHMGYGLWSYTGGKEGRSKELGVWLDKNVWLIASASNREGCRQNKQ